MIISYIRGSETERFWPKVEKTEDCWIWRASLKDGYGAFRTAEQITVRAHKWLWEDINGKTPAGLELDHLCNNRACVRPEHLEPVTHQENCSRALPGKRSWRKNIIHCPKGHEYSKGTYYVRAGRSIHRQCKECKLEYQRRRRQCQSSHI